MEIAREALGFKLELHTPSEIDQFNSGLEAKYVDTYGQARASAQGSEDAAKAFQIQLMQSLANPQAPKLTKEEVRFMLNEQALIQCDAAYFLTRYYWIKDRRNVIRRFAFQTGQRVLFDAMAELERLGRAIEILLPKARQLGCSTLVEGLILQKSGYSYGANAVIASADQDKLNLMSMMLFLGYDQLPWWIRPLTTKRVQSAKGMIVFGGMQSVVSFQHGNQRNPIAMGSTPIAWHLSELSSYPNAYDQVEVGLFKAVHPSPRVFGVGESTCKGDTGWFYDTYWWSKNNWKKGKSRLMALFLPFYLGGADMYPNPTEKLSHPVPSGWKPELETRRMIAESEMYVHSNDVLSKVLGRDWVMPREKSHYWEWNFLEARSKGKEKMWFQEMPHTDVAAFQGSYDNVFGREIIAEVWTKRKHDYSVYGIVGQSIEERLEPLREDLDLSEPIIPVVYRSLKGDVYRWELMPLQWEEPFEALDEIRDEEDHMGKFFVWLPPEPGYDYSIGIDTSNGIGCDSTCIAVSRRGRTPQEQDVQAAEFRSNLVSHVDAYAWALAIAAFYARYMEDSTPYREPYVAIEQIAAVGDTCNLQMRKMGYNRFHKMIRYDSTPKQMRKSKAHKVGWFTSSWSRPMLTDGFVTLVKNGWYKVNSPYTMREMTQWEVHYTAAGKDKFEHAEDATDDGIFANAMAAFCPNDISKMADRSKKQFTGERGEKLPALSIAPPKGMMVSAEGHGTMDMEEFAGRRW